MVLSVTIFVLFVVAVLWLSLYLARQASSASGYFAAGGNIHWGVNGIAFAGDYLSAASFLGICGLIATVGYDGFLYSIGYLAGWIVALFVVAEPMKRLGKYTFTDALDSKFSSRGIQLAAGISTLVVSTFYLIPQMVGAGVLVKPLLGLPHAVGVVIVGAIVITIVASAGMTSTTYVQFIKGAMLIFFSLIISIAVCYRGLSTTPDQGGKVPFHEYAIIDAKVGDAGQIVPADGGYQVEAKHTGANDALYLRLKNGETANWWKKITGQAEGQFQLQEMASVTIAADGSRFINGKPATGENQQLQVGNLTQIQGKTGDEADTGPVGPFKLFAIIDDPQTTVRQFKKETSFSQAGYSITLFAPVDTPGNLVLRPGLKTKLESGTWMERLDFASLMLALFCGTAALPHILIRYYTVPTPAAARKSTIVAIAAIGFFYVLTLYMGVGAMVNAVIDPTDNNMSAPLLARSFGTVLFAIISAIAFATVLGTVAGLIVAASGAVAHDLLDRYSRLELNDRQKVAIGKAAAIMIGFLAVILGIVFEGMNVSFLVGLAFAVAASANLPAVIMLLFWKRTTSQGIVASILVGVITSIGLIAFSPEMYVQYGLPAKQALVPFSNPGMVSIPLSFITLIVVSLMTNNTAREASGEEVTA